MSEIPTQEVAAKTCKDCGAEKPIMEFYANRKMRDGRGSRCKECTRQRNREYREANPDKVRQWSAAKRARDPEKHRENCRRWAKKNREKRREMRRQWREENPEKYEAHLAVNNAILAGRLTRPKECSHCQKEARVEAHHEDYSKPLNVRWLCSYCHKAAHRGEI